MYQPKYQITNTILKNVSLIEAAREVIENAALVPHWEAQFRRDAIVRSVHYGTHLEGNPLSKEQVEKVVIQDGDGDFNQQDKSTKPRPRKVDPVSVYGLASAHNPVVAKERDIQEVLNYREVLRFIDSIGIPVESSYGRIKTELTPYTIDILKEIHTRTSYKILPDEEQGKIRTAQVIIRNRATGEVIFRPPPAVAVYSQLSEFFDWLNSPEGREHNTILRAGISHWELVRIHPFTDGNGRSARAMVLFLLFQEGYDVKKFFSIEQYYDQNPRDYYDALASVGGQRDGDVTGWLEYFSDGLAIELSRVKERVLALSRDLKLKSRLGKQVPLSERQIKILEFMDVNRGQMTTKETFTAIPMTSRDTIIRDINRLIKKGLIIRMGRTKGARYMLNE